jgi:phosphoglycerate dehydrogenase-like enzyme
MTNILSQSDIISLHAPLTDATRNMINEDALNSMKPGAYLINVARAELVDEKALAEAIMKERLPVRALMSSPKSR